MTTRRDLIKIASALGVAGALPSSAERVAAMQLLDRDVSANVLLDPGGFAGEADGSFGGALSDDWLCAINPVRHAHYAQAHENLKRAVTILDTKEGYRAYGDYEGDIFNFIMASYYGGLRHGAAYENLRRSVIGELTQCRDCWGVGATKDRDVCASCGGTGTVALRA